MNPTIHSIAKADNPGPRTQGGRELARALALLEGNDSRTVTLAALRERGVNAPAQAIYDLQLAGHTIDRFMSTDSAGHASPGYHLRRPPAPAPESSGASTSGGQPAFPASAIRAVCAGPYQSRSLTHQEPSR
jgi:hypothetical protein